MSSERFEGCSHGGRRLVHVPQGFKQDKAASPGSSLAHLDPSSAVIPHPQHRLGRLTLIPGRGGRPADVWARGGFRPHPDCKHGDRHVDPKSQGEWRINQAECDEKTEVAAH